MNSYPIQSNISTPIYTTTSTSLPNMKELQRKQVKDILRNDPELLSEIIVELRKEKIKKLMNN